MTAVLLLWNQANSLDSLPKCDHWIFMIHLHNNRIHCVCEWALVCVWVQMCTYVLLVCGSVCVWEYCENENRKTNIHRVVVLMCTKIRYANNIRIYLFSHQKNQLLHLIRRWFNTQNKPTKIKSTRLHTHNLPHNSRQIESPNQKLLFMDLVTQKSQKPED